MGFFLNLSEYPVRLRSGDYGNTFPEAKQASLSMTDSNQCPGLGDLGKI